MSKVCGPILGFRGRVGEEWRVAIAQDGGTEPGALTYAERGQAAGSGVPAARLGEVAATTFFGYEFAVPMQADERVFEYGFAGEERRWRFAVPGRAQRCALAMPPATGSPCRAT
jgi:hypothetical protein